MEGDTDMTNTYKERGVKFTAADIPKIEKLFKEADTDGGGGLDLKEFHVAMTKLHGKSMSEEEATLLHMKIDTNCDGTVDRCELINYLVNESMALGSMNHKNECFPKPFRKIPLDCRKQIVGLLFLPNKNNMESDDILQFSEVWPFQTGRYLSISENGVLTFWTDRFERKSTIELSKARQKKMCVTDMVYITELKQLAVSTLESEVLFYSCGQFPKHLELDHSLIVEDDVVRTMNYWSNGTKAVFSFGDGRGYLSVFISHDVNNNGLFCREGYKKISLQKYPTAYVSTLLKQHSPHFQCVKVYVFPDICRQVQYFPSIDSFTICGNQSEIMVLVSLPKQCKTKCSKTVFRSTGYTGFFTCAEYLTLAECLLTGGRDGVLRIWFPHKNLSCIKAVEGHVSPITHIMDISRLQICVSLSMDKNVRVWCEKDWLCLQSFQVEDMGLSPLSSVCYNRYNNELVVANSNIAKCMGRGTNVFQNTLTSHEKPLCCALYHSVYKQVISVCRKGVVTVWNILSGKAVMKFKVTPEQDVGLTTMAFDGPQRRLITISQDGKVKLWNFSNGTELAVLPVTVPTDVTGLFCLNNRLYVSGRNSRIIFDLDMKGYNSRSLEHHQLSDISSMDVHNGTLVTASSDGNIVNWDAKTTEVLFFANASESPRIQLAGRKDQGIVNRLPVEKIQKKVRGSGTRTPLRKSKALTEEKTNANNRPIILCLKTRETNLDTATLLTTSDGYIYAWINNSKGGLLAKFRAVNDEGAFITTMSTDVNEETLLIGDSTGRIYLWDIQGFGFTETTKEGPFEIIKGRLVFVRPPPLLRSWQAHSREVVSVQCDPACKYIITAGLDHNVWLWSKTGSAFGLFGRDTWDATQPIPEDKAHQDQVPQPSTDQITSCQETPSPASSRSQSVSPISDSESVESLKLKYQPEWEFVAKSFAKSGKQLQEASVVTRKQENESRHSESRFKRNLSQTSFISTHADVKESSPQQTFKRQYRYLYKAKPYFHEWDTLKHSVLIPHPPDSVPCRQKSEQTPNHKLLSSVCDRVQLTHHQTEFKPKNSLPAGRNDVTKSVPKLVNTVKQKSEDTSNHVRLPPIHDKVQFNKHPPERPPITSQNDITKSLRHMPKFVNTVKQEAAHLSNHVSFSRIRDDGQLKPRPPERPPITNESPMTKSLRHRPKFVNTVKQEAAHVSNHVSFSRIRDDGQLKPRPPERPPITNESPMTKSLRHRPKFVNTVKQEAAHVSNHVRFSRIHDGQLKPRPPERPPITNKSPMTKSLRHRPKFVNTVKQEAAHVSNHVTFSCNHDDGQLKPLLPERPPITNESPMTKSLRHRPKSVNTVKQEAAHVSNHVSFSRIHDDGQLKPRPPERPPIVNPNHLPKSPSKFRRIKK